MTVPLTTSSSTECTYQNVELDEATLLPILEQIPSESSGNKDIVLKGEFCAIRDEDRWDQKFQFSIGSGDMDRWGVFSAREGGDNAIDAVFRGISPFTGFWEGFDSTPDSTP